MGKTKLRIMNIVYLIFSGVAVFWYSLNFIQPDKAPFLKFGIEAELTQENSGALVESFVNGIDGLTAEDIFAEGPLTIQADVSIKNQMLVDVWQTSDATSFVDNTIIQPNVDSLVEQLKPTLNRVVKSSAKAAVKTQVEEQLKDTIGPGEDLYAKLAISDPSLTSEQLSTDIGNVIDELLKEDATLDSVNSTLTETYNKYSEALGSPTKTEAEMKTELEETLNSLHALNEDGSIDMDKALAYFLESAFGSESDKTGDGETSTALHRALMHMFSEEASESESEIAKTIKNKINESLTPEMKSGIAIGFKVAGIVLALFILGWAIKLLQCILGFFISKPYIRKELIGSLTKGAQLILAIISAFLLCLFKFGGVEWISANIPSVDALIKAIPVPVDAIKSLELTFSAMIPGAIVVLDAIYSLFYNHAKKKFKKQLKSEGE